MISVKMLKPYYIKADDQYVRIILAYQYFSVIINKKVYQFIPVEAKEIRINRRTRKVDNVGSRFAFQKGKEIIYMTMTELITLPDFLTQLHNIAKPYYDDINVLDETVMEKNLIIDELEKNNIKRLIDKALDERDEKTFRDLVKLL
ncbi:IDEAL domain-containing protein [Ornithinibacillus californiensis]|uniref:IDEAL domain-containing protein n=1 Tax=Ornithinibacillus californiensis TaxID=161536 RepID=UPI00064E1065|nr:IDEAL domain-containing protein [Ornithinibacillus californiensis]